MKESYLVKSLKGHDSGRIYVVIATLNEDFVLCCDGKYRKLDNPKQKRKKHLEVLNEIVFSQPLTDAKVRKLCKM